MIVVDASVAVKWLLPEDGDELAQRLLTQDRRLIAPELVKLEVVGAVIRRYREKTLSEDEVRRIYAAWGRLLADGRPALHPMNELFEQAFEFSIRARHAIADCTYLALAEQTGAVLVTCDKALIERGKKVYSRVKLLGQLA